MEPDLSVSLSATSTLEIFVDPTDFHTGIRKASNESLKESQMLAVTC